MAAAPSSSLSYPPTFQTVAGPGRDISPKAFREFLNETVNQDSLASNPTQELLENKEKWIALIHGLANEILGHFPYFEPELAGTVNEKIALAHISLDIFPNVLEHAEALYSDDQDLTKVLFVKLVGFCMRAETWAEVIAEGQDEAPSASALYPKASASLVRFLRALGGSLRYGRRQRLPLWKTLDEILRASLDICEEIITNPLPSCPLRIQFFTTPHIVTHGTSDDEQSWDLCVILPTGRQVSVFSSIIMEAISKTLYPPLLSHCFLVDRADVTLRLVRATFYYCLSSPTSSEVRWRSLSRLASAARSIISHSVLSADAVLDLSPRALLLLLEEGPKPSSISYSQLYDTLKVDFQRPPISKCSITPILKILKSRSWQDPNDNLSVLALSYVQSCINDMNLAELHSMRMLIESGGMLKDSGAIVKLIDDRLSRLSHGRKATSISSLASPAVEIRQVLEKIIAPHQVQWMEFEEDSPVTLLFHNAFDDIEARFRSPLHDCSAEARLSLIENFKTLLEYLQGIRQSLVAPAFFNTAAPTCALLTQLLNGSDQEVTPKVRRRSFELILAALRSQSQEKLVDELGKIADLLQRGISDKDRSVRLSAGSSMVEFIKLHEILGEARSIEAMFAVIRRILESSAKAALKETALIFAGSIAKEAKSEALGQALFCLTTQLGDNNPTLKSIAYMKLLEVSKARNTTSYSLFSPYMSGLAPYIVSRICTKPALIMETSRFLMIRHQDFINLTLPSTLPHLFASCDSRAIEQVANEVGTTQSKLFLNHAHIVLADVFQLQGPGQPAKSLNFIVNTLVKDSVPSNTSSIDVQSITQICVVPLLAELVVALGDTGDNEALALQALKRIDRLLNATTEERPSASQPNVAELLHSYMLGVLSYLNDMLQDVKGKKSVAVKCQIIRGLGEFVKHIGPPVQGIAPQIMATLQTMLLVPELAEATLSSWFIFLSTLSEKDVASYLGPTSASLLCSWPALTPSGRQAAYKCLEFIVINEDELLDEVVDMSSIPDLQEVSQRLLSTRRTWSSRTKLKKILDRSASDNYAVTMQALRELKSFMLNSSDAFVRSLTSGDTFDPLSGRVFSVLLSAACRDGHHESLRLMAFECMGILGALDPDRCEIGASESNMIVRTNFNDEAESVLFAIHLIKDVLVGAFRSTTDIKYQGHLAFTIQELLRFCNFTQDLVVTGKTTSIPSRVRNRWASLPKHVIETVAPLLGARFSAPRKPLPIVHHPIYQHEKTYREWLQLWTAYLITKASGKTAKTIFGNFHSAIRNKDVGVAHHILPHLVLNILVSGHEDDAQAILAELLAVLEDQVDPTSRSNNDKKFLSAQVVFMLLDHISKYIRILRQEIANRKADNKRTRAQQMAIEGEDLLIRLDSVTSNINHELMAKAALQCQAYARALMHFEQQITVIKERQGGVQNKELVPYYDKLHEIYAQLDEPDGMEGISTLILSPSLEHQIRQHESTGHWTSAQSCWEVRLQQDPDNLDFHLGLLRCLRNLGHYDTLRTHVQGVLVRNPGWNDALAGYQAESAWVIGAWDDVERIVKSTSNRNLSLAKADILLAIRSGDAARAEEALSSARSVIGSSITTSGVSGYRRSYDALLDLHLIHEIELIRDSTFNLPSNSQERRTQLRSLSNVLEARLDKTLPNYRTREMILSMRRTAFSLSTVLQPSVTTEVGRSWLASAKIARKTGQWQTAYSAMLQAQQSQLKFSFMESAKLVKAAGEPLRALQELENSMRLAGILESKSDTIDLTNDTDASKKMVAKAYVLLARWMNESDRFETSDVLNTFGKATDLSPHWESGFFYLGQFHDQCYKMLPPQDQEDRGTRMNLHTIRNFAKAIIHGSKYVYQTVPRLLTLWLDMGEHRNIRSSPTFAKVNGAVSAAVENIPVYKWFTAFPQIVSRVGHDNNKVYQILAKLIAKVITAYPHQALWLFTSVVKSTKSHREERGRNILEKLKNDIANAGTPLPGLIQECGRMTDELLRMCNYPMDDDRKVLSMKKSFPALARLGRSSLIIPLQESLTPSVPVSSPSSNDYNPFSSDAPTFHEFFDDIEVMRSLARPRKITIRGSDGQIYMFLGKPKDDLRKDARLMDFNAIINKLLKANSESRRRQLHIRTYGVVTLNEECGFIQWVPNTIPLRPVLVKGYDSRRVRSWSPELNEVFKRIKEVPEKEAAVIFQTKVLTQFPPVFHEWFIETFPEPSAWLASRLSYGRTAAVMSMVGFILGLGDRHCENILLDVNTGDAVHVDFNCLFEKGKTLETPERVPFRLTQNLVDGLGVTGVEGVFRIACEVTMRLLRDNKDSLMSVLDAFIHDPLVEWEDEKRKIERDGAKRNVVRSTVDLRHLAKNALNPIEKKLTGVYVARSNKERVEKEMSTSNLVQVLIQESTDLANLAKMYPGWCSWH